MVPRSTRSGVTVFGHSSGGYAALIHAMRHGERWGAAASHSGDVGFELVYGREFPGALTELARFDDAGAFLEKLWASDKIRGRQFNTLIHPGLLGQSFKVLEFGA